VCLTEGVCWTHASFWPNRVLAAAPFSVCHTYNLNRRGATFGASRRWHTRIRCSQSSVMQTLAGSTPNATPLRLTLVRTHFFEDAERSQQLRSCPGHDSPPVPQSRYLPFRPQHVLMRSTPSLVFSLENLVKLLQVGQRRFIVVGPSFVL
jgi:hypothetical protein